MTANRMSGWQPWIKLKLVRACLIVMVKAFITLDAVAQSGASPDK